MASQDQYLVFIKKHLNPLWAQMNYMNPGYFTLAAIDMKP